MLSAAQLRNAGHIDNVVVQGRGEDFSAVTTVYTVHRINDTTLESETKMTEFHRFLDDLTDFCKSVPDVVCVKTGIDLSSHTMYFAAILGNVPAIEAVFVNGFELFLTLLSHCTKEEMICTTIDTEVEHLKSVMERFGVPPRFAILPHLIRLDKKECRSRQKTWQEINRTMRVHSDVHDDSILIFECWKIKEECLQDDAKFDSMIQDITKLGRSCGTGIEGLFLKEPAVNREAGEMYVFSLYASQKSLQDTYELFYVHNKTVMDECFFKHVLADEMNAFSSKNNSEFASKILADCIGTTGPFIEAATGISSKARPKGRKTSQKTIVNSDIGDTLEKIRKKRSSSSLFPKNSKERMDCSSMTTFFRVFKINDETLASETKMTELKSTITSILQRGKCLKDCAYDKAGFLGERVYFACLYGNIDAVEAAFFDIFELYETFLTYVIEEETIITTSTESDVERLRSLFMTKFISTAETRFAIVPSLQDICLIDDENEDKNDNSKKWLQNYLEEKWKAIAQYIANDNKKFDDPRDELNVIFGKWKVNDDVLNDEIQLQKLKVLLSKLKTYVLKCNWQDQYFWDFSLNVEAGEVYYQELFMGRSASHDHFMSGDTELCGPVKLFLMEYGCSDEVFFFATKEHNVNLCRELMKEKKYIVKNAEKSGLIESFW